MSHFLSTQCVIECFLCFLSVCLCMLALVGKSMHVCEGVWLQLKHETELYGSPH